MLSKPDQLRARFAPGDPVEFGYLDYLIKGTVIRLNPTRAVVNVDDEEFTVPYERLKPSSPIAEERVLKIESVHQAAIDLMEAHGLQDWNFKFDQSTRRAGCCDYRRKTLYLSMNHARCGTEEQIRDTILHEIAHALAGPEHHHDTVWKSKAIEIGCSGDRTHNLDFAPPRWSVTCENQCWTHTAQQRNARLICRSCGSKLVYTPWWNHDE